MTPFVFKHAGRTGFFAWLKYKGKESWILARAIFLLFEADGPVVIIHNSVSSKLRITQEFVSLRARDLDYGNARMVTTLGVCGLIGIPVSITALALFLLPLGTMKVMVKMILARRAVNLERVVVFFDGHLSGFILAITLKELGVDTATLQHGLYRRDDPGSHMALANFVSTKIFLWDENTKDEFIRFGVAPDNLQVCGQYGFSHLFPRRELSQDHDLIALCPPYDKGKAHFFMEIADTLQHSREVRYSLHPIINRALPELRSEPLARMTPRPRVSICGDSAVILDSLACGVPVISVGPRALASTHLFFEDELPKESDWELLIANSIQEYNNDLRAFGFSPS